MTVVMIHLIVIENQIYKERDIAFIRRLSEKLEYRAHPDSLSNFRQWKRWEIVTTNEGVYGEVGLSSSARPRISSQGGYTEGLRRVERVL